METSSLVGRLPVAISSLW